MLSYCRGDADAFETLYQRHRGPLYRFVLRQCGQVFADELYQDIWLNPENFKITRVTLKEITNDNKLDAYYGDFKDYEGQLFPYDIVYEITSNEKITVEVKYSRIRINEPFTCPFTIPSKYERIN